MAIRTNSYGTVGEVAALTPLYATSGGKTYDISTAPTLVQVEKFIDRVSAIVNTLLAEVGFAIPVTQADAKLVLDDFVVTEAAGLAEYANGAGPFVPQSNKFRTPTPQRIILKDAELFISTHAGGLEKLGATRTYRKSYGLSCRTTDASGDTIVPPFSRGQMGHEIINWDAA